MNIEEKIKRVEDKIKLYKTFDLFLRVILTIVGTVSLVSILMFLNSRFGISFFNCLLITCVVPSVYSLCVNVSLERFNKKIKNMECELLKIEDEYNQKREKLDLIDKSNDSVIEKIEFRFEGLSNERKIELLNYMKNVIPDCYLQYMDDFERMDLSLEEIDKTILSRKKKKIGDMD